MSNVYRTGIVVITKLLEHISRTVLKYRPSLNAQISAAVTAGTISSAQATVMLAFLDSIPVAVELYKIVSGY